jgi:hypothetical protein
MKVLLATPLSASGADSNYIRTLCGMLTAKLPGVHLDYMVSDTGCISFARNDIAFEAERGGFDKVVMADDDNLYTPENFLRIISHDVDVVAGPYCKRRPGKPNYLFVPLKGATVQANGMLECVRVATGLISIKVSALTKMRAAFPELEFLAQDKPDEAVVTRCNWFPMGVTGPRTAEARLDAVRDILLRSKTQSIVDYPDSDMIADIQLAISEAHPAGTLKGEDYYFSDLVRRAGMKIYIDLGLPVIPHVGHVAYPITPEMVGFTPGAPMVLPMAEEG